MRQAKIYRKEMLAGMLTEDGGNYTFIYDSAYLASPSPVAISLTLPLQKEAYRSPVLFPFFDGLIPEGWLLDVALRKIAHEVKAHARLHGEFLLRHAELLAEPLNRLW